MKVARYCNRFSGSMPSNFEYNYIAADKHLENIAPTVLLDEDENLS